MPSPEFERMDALSEAIVRLLRRQEETDRRLAGIEKSLGIEGAPAPTPPFTPPPKPPPDRPRVDVLPPIHTPPQAPVVPTQAPPQLETRVGSAWINRIGAITLALCAAFAFKYAVDSAWIGPAGRVAIGVLAGMIALAAADRIWRGGQKTYAHGIAGLGIAILYLSFYAAFGFYRLVDQGLAFALMALTTALAGVCALRYDAQAIAALGLLGGYATPVLLSGGEDRPWVLFTYVLLLDLGALWTARLKKWRPLETLAFLSTMILYGGWMLQKIGPEKRTVAAVFAFIYYALFAISETPLIFVLSQALAALVMTEIWRGSITPFALSSLSLVVAGLGISNWRKRSNAISVTFAAFWLAYAVWWDDFPGTPQPEPVVLYLTAAFAIFFGVIAWRFLFRDAVFTRADALLLALNGAVYFGVSYELLKTDYQAYLGLFAVALAAAHLALAFMLWRGLPEENRDTRVVLLPIGIALTFLTLAAPIQFAGYRITMAWALEMAALVWIGSRVNSKPAIYAALAILALVLIRLDYIDAWMYSSAADYNMLGNARFLTFVIAAAAAWASAFWTEAGVKALIFYLGGHYVMLWALGLEALGWVERGVAVDNLRSAQSAAISVLMAIYAVLMIGGGVLYRSTVNRMVGLGLIGVVIAKLYLYDVWLLVRIYRIVAFGALGALLLLTSYVYSRNRESIENWWNNRNARS